MRHHFLIVVALTASIGCGRTHSGRLTAMNIIAVRPGMSMEQVRSILGQPLKEDSVTQPCAWFTFAYTEKGALPFPYPMVWVHFNARREVVEVFVKKYISPSDHRPIYVAGQGPCGEAAPILPSSTETMKIDALMEFFDRE